MNNLEKNPADNKGIESHCHNTDTLIVQLNCISGKQPVSTIGINTFGGKEAKTECSQYSANSMNPHDIKRIIQVKPAFGTYCHKTAKPGKTSNNDRRIWADKTSRRSNSSQPADRPGGSPKCRGLPQRQPFHNYPHEHPCHSGHMGGNKSCCSNFIGRQSRTTIKTEPAKPKQPRPQHGHGQIMGHEISLTISPSRTDHKHTGKGSCTACGMNHQAAGKIENTKSGQPSAFSPHPVTDRIVHKNCPEQ